MKRLNFLDNFPANIYPKPRDKQVRALEILSKAAVSTTFELPTATGKTAIGYTVLKTLERTGKKALFYITPTKTLVDQMKKTFTDAKVIYGRNEYPCLYYGGKESAEDVPCSMLDCPHRVNLETGEVQACGVSPCPYLDAKYEAKKGGIVVCTTAFYLFSHLFTKDWEEPEGLVIDEVHRIARTIRNSLSYEITDYHLQKSIQLLDNIEAEESEILERFLKTMTKIVKRRPSNTSVLLEDYEIAELLEILNEIKPSHLRRKISQAVKSGLIDPVNERVPLKKLEMLSRNLIRYLRSLEFSLPEGRRKPLNYTYAYYDKELREHEKAQYRLYIKAYYVAPIIQRILAPLTVTYSATIGDPRIFGFETGIEFPFHAFDSTFPAKNAKIYIPIDTANLAMKLRGRQDMTRTLRKIAKACKTFKSAGLRSLVIVVSEKERHKFLTLAEEEGVRVMSYGYGAKAREAAKKFAGGNEDTLVGTVANYGEGVDLPRRLAPVIFFLRPGYPNPTDPAAIFETRRFGRMCWKLWDWRVIIEALQVRGRNVRSERDRGVTFFISQQFRHFIPATLPSWLKEAYNGELTFEDCILDAKQLLKK